MKENSAEFMDKAKKHDSSIQKYLPMIVCQLYLAFVFFLVLFGPWPWKFPNISKLILFILVCNFTLLIGYFLAIKIYKVRKSTKVVSSSSKLFKVIFILFLISTPIVFFIRTSINLFNVVEVYQTFILGITNPAALYYNKIRLFQSGDTSMIFTLIDILLTPIYYMMLALLIFGWKSIKLSYKGIILFCIGIHLTSWILIGTNKGLFDIVIIAIVFGIYKIITLKKNQVFNIKTLVFSTGFVLLVAIVLAYFDNSIDSRVGELVYSPAADIVVDENSLIYKSTPDSLKSFIVTLSSYLTQGYYGLSLALEEPFTSTFFIGSSTFFSNAFENFLGISYFNDFSYPAKIEVYGWDKYVNWHTAYTWFASDISFYGVPILMGIFGFMMGVFWKESLLNNPYSMGLFVLMMILVIYIPANNQIFSFPGTYFSFCLFFLFMFVKKYFVKPV